MSTDLRLTDLAARLPATVPFTSPETLEAERGQSFAARLGANENGFGPSPATQQAIAAAADKMWCYGDCSNRALIEALAAHHQIAPGHITIGEGIDGLLGNLVRLTTGPGTAVITSEGAYPTFAYHVIGFGGQLHTVPYRDDHEDSEALLEAALRHGARLIYLANPDNPMGTMLPPAQIEALVEKIPETALLVLDEAYLDCADAAATPQIAPDDPRVIRMRTFSKAYGLAGLRIGYAIGPQPLIAAFDRVRNHFGVNHMAQVAALAALEDQAGLATILDDIAAARERPMQIAAENGLTALPSQANFVAIDCGEDGAFARAVLAALMDEGIFARMPGVAPLDRCIRVSCGPAPALDLFAQALPKALAQARGA